MHFVKLVPALVLTWNCRMMVVVVDISFEECDIDEAFKENVRKAHYDKPTPIQKWAIPVIGSGRDLMGCAQTGSGKTVRSISCSNFAVT